MIWYTCPKCGIKIQFYSGFVIHCHGRIDNPKHAFNPELIDSDMS